jgi:NAD(P)-dependent dehydrogenase (short-subunit alcohol dehydrogenase family)
VLPQIGVYCMSKAGVVQMTKAMAVEWGKYGINTNAICPGYISTEINEDYFASAGPQADRYAAAQASGKPEDLDGLLLLLAGEDSNFINGAIISADDGMTAA